MEYVGAALVKTVLLIFVLRTPNMEKCDKGVGIPLGKNKKRNRSNVPLARH